MKIICELTGRLTGDRITDKEIELAEIGGFGACLHNPFPASELVSVFFTAKSAVVTYRVAQAWGEA